jgi:O-antigen/teichoic acid export membrane protein
MAMGWVTVIFIALVLSVASFFGVAPLARSLHVSVPDMRIILYSSVILLCSSMATGVISAYPIGRRRMVSPNVGATCGGVINFVASVGSIALGAKLPAYALANAGAGIVGVLVMAALVRRAEGPLPLAIPELSRVRSFLGFSLNNQVVRITALVNYQTDKVVIAFTAGPAAAGAYELANRVAIAIRAIGLYATLAVNVELASMFRQFGLDRVRARYLRLNQVTAALSFPPVLLTMATAPLLLAAWLSHAPPNSTAVLVALASAYLLGVSTGVGYGITVAAGEPGLVAKASVGTMVANIVLTASLAPVFGVWGVLGGTVVALSAGAIAQVVLVHRRYRLPATSYLGAIGPALRVYVILAAPVAVISYAHIVHGRAAQAVMFVALSLAYLGACMTWAMKAGRLPPTLTSRLPRVGWLRPSA